MCLSLWNSLRQRVERANNVEPRLRNKSVLLQGPPREGALALTAFTNWIPALLDVSDHYPWRAKRKLSLQYEYVQLPLISASLMNAA